MDHGEIADPRGGQRQAGGGGVAPARRPETLRGRSVGLLDNGKPNAAEALRGLGSGLRAHHGAQERPVTKALSSKPCPDDLLTSLAEADAAVVGVGD